jgi:hypothetical protein
MRLSTFCGLRRDQEQFLTTTFEMSVASIYEAHMGGIMEVIRYRFVNIGSEKKMTILLLIQFVVFCPCSYSAAASVLLLLQQLCLYSSALATALFLIFLKYFLK